LRTKKIRTTKIKQKMHFLFNFKVVGWVKFWCSVAVSTDHAGANLAALGFSCIYVDHIPLISRNKTILLAEAPRTPFSMRHVLSAWFFPKFGS
jgi:hypothetical protein